MLTMDEVAREFRVGRKTIERWVASRKVVGTKIGRRWLFDEGYIAALKKKHQSPDFGADLRRRLSGRAGLAGSTRGRESGAE